MSKVFQAVPDVLKKAGQALSGYDEMLPQSTLTPGFKGKGLLTALIDNTHSELARRRQIEDDLRSGKGGYLIENFWNAVKQGTPAEMRDYQDRLLEMYGQDKHTKKWLVEHLFPRAEQLQQATQQFKAPGSVVAKPEMPANPDELPVDPSVASTYSGLTPPPGQGGPTNSSVPSAAPALGSAPFQASMEQIQDPEAGTMPMEANPVSRVSTSVPAGPVAAGITPPPQPTPIPAQPPRIPQPPAPLNPLQSILQKVSPIPLTEREKLQYAEDTRAYGATTAHGDKMSEQAAKDAAEMARLQAGIAAGRYNKALKLLARTEVINGKNMDVAYWVDPLTGQEVTKKVLGEHSDAPGRSDTQFLARTYMANDPDLNPAEAVEMAAQVIAFQRATGRGAFAPTVRESNAGQNLLGETVFTPTVSERQAPPNPSPTARGASYGAVRQGMTPPPVPGATQPQTPAPARPLTAPASPQLQPGQSRAIPGTFGSGQLNAQRQVAMPVLEAGRQIVQGPDSLATFADLANDKAAANRIGTAFGIMRRAMDHGSTGEAMSASVAGHGASFSGDLWNWFANSTGITQAVAGSEASLVQSAIEAMKPREREALSALVATYGTVVGLRAATKGGAYEASIKRIEAELPTFINTMTADEFETKIAKTVGEIVQVVDMIPNAIPAGQREYYHRWLDDYAQRKGASGKGGGNSGLAKPPAVSSASPATYTLPDGTVLDRQPDGTYKDPKAK